MYKLGHPSHFHYLNQSKTYELDGVNSAEEYMKTIRAMDIVGISHGEQVFLNFSFFRRLGNAFVACCFCVFIFLHFLSFY